MQSTVDIAVDGKAENVVKLIKVFTPTITSFGSSTSRTFKSGFDHKNYEEMKTIINVIFAYNILAESNISKEPFDLSEIPDRDALSDSQLISIFMQFFENTRVKQ
ncbi:MAG: hypothetical protein EOO90_23560 [Pedobacter sp.]|nr:MAG: hypothetical protein EOO90_23560 [Pedobacter sp.]